MVYDTVPSEFLMESRNSAAITVDLGREESDGVVCIPRSVQHSTLPQKLHPLGGLLLFNSR